MSTKSMELNDLNVNNVLDEIRPYIEADGGYQVAIDDDSHERSISKSSFSTCARRD